MEKFEIDIKWGSYLFVVNLIVSTIITLFMFLIDGQSLRYFDNVIVIVLIILLFYFTNKAIRENKKYGLSRGYRKFFVFIRLLTFFFLLASFLNGSAITSTSSWYLSLFVPYREKDISELLEDDSHEYNGVTIKEFVVALKRKFARA
ncbi:hypothetical protein [Flavobacterium sp. DG2-3]|uniref:hypothetical protein n=1 Tax=Flavobacterium sp. DG2-3 TaxID=3068317 RepID=UPI00273F85F5|nr:hypothetical protein [Flavobacterium sp. DG2-3]MDP5198287.1 hypothetical protein [Flavobacterium sp. DG2-3]